MMMSQRLSAAMSYASCRRRSFFAMAGASPPTLLVLVAHDPLRDEGMALARRMAAEGNEVTLIEYQGLAHGYLVQGAVVRAARWALRQFGQCLRDALRGE